MNPRAVRARSIVGFAVVLLCEFLAPCLLFTSVSFGMELGDLKGSPHVRVQDLLRLDHAGDLAMLGFILLEIAATWALMKIVSRGRLSWVKAGMRASLAFIGLGALSYVIVIAALMGFAFDPLLSVEQVLEHWALILVS